MMSGVKEIGNRGRMWPTFALAGLAVVIVCLLINVVLWAASAPQAEPAQNQEVRDFIKASPLVEVVHVGNEGYSPYSPQVTVKLENGEFVILAYKIGVSGHITREDKGNVYVPGYFYETYEKDDPTHSWRLIVGLRRP